jgi:hypothetical protein
LERLQEFLLYGAYIRRPYKTGIPAMFLKLFRRNTNRDSCEKHSTGTGITGIRRIPAGKCNLVTMVVVCFGW